MLAQMRISDNMLLLDSAKHLLRTYIHELQKLAECSHMSFSSLHKIIMSDEGL